MKLKELVKHQFQTTYAEKYMYLIEDGASDEEAHHCAFSSTVCSIAVEFDMSEGQVWDMFEGYRA